MIELVTIQKQSLTILEAQLRVRSRQLIEVEAQLKAERLRVRHLRRLCAVLFVCVFILVLTVPFIHY